MTKYQNIDGFNDFSIHTRKEITLNCTKNVLKVFGKKNERK